MGESIVAYPDGSWRYFDANNKEDQLLMKTYLKSVEAPENTTVTNLSLHESLVKALREEEKASANFQNAIRNKTRAETAYKLLKKSEFSSEEQLELAKLELDYADNQESAMQKRWISASKEARKYEKIQLMEPEQQAKALAKIQGRKIPKTAKIKKTSKTKTKKPKKKRKKKGKKKKRKKDSSKKSKTPKKKSTGIKNNPLSKLKLKKDPIPIGVEPDDSSPYNGKPATAFAKLSPEENVMLNPPEEPCVIAFEGKDDFTGKNRKDVAPADFFSYTDDKLRSVFKDKDMIACTGHVSSVTGGLKFLALKIVINDEKAQTNYGILEKGSLLTVRLVDGTNVQLINKKTNQGTVNRFEQNVSYTAQYNIGPNQEKALRKMEIDKVRIIWSTGFEEYDVYETDFLMNQLNCLSK